jgi:ABC-2 type transport system permease protein
MRSRPGGTAPRSLYEVAWGLGLLNVWAIAVRELRAYFVSWMGWGVTALIVVLLSFFGYVVPVLGGQQAGMDGVFGVAPLLMVFATPLYTMRLLAEERSSGTLEVTLTSPVRDWELVLGKWLGVLLFYAATIACTLLYLLLLMHDEPGRTAVHLGHASISVPALDYGSILAGYTGLLLLGMAFCAVGLLTSSLTGNQIVAATVALVLLLLLWALGSLSLVLQGTAGDFADYAGASNRFSGFSSGEIALRDVASFLSVTAGALYLATRVLDSRRWR